MPAARSEGAAALQLGEDRGGDVGNPILIKVSVRGGQPPGGTSTQPKSARIQWSIFCNPARSSCWRSVCGVRHRPAWKPRSSTAVRTPSGKSAARRSRRIIRPRGTEAASPRRVGRRGSDRTFSGSIRGDAADGVGAAVDADDQHWHQNCVQPVRKKKSGGSASPPTSSAS